MSSKYTHDVSEGLVQLVLGEEYIPVTSPHPKVTEPYLARGGYP